MKRTDRAALPAQALRRSPIDVVARHPATSIGVAFLTWVVHIFITAGYGAPLPQTQDEFSYLLAADTFSHGRLTNASHPMWEFFETFQVLQRPTYQSKYPPGQGLILAAGTWVMGAPIFGAGFAAAFACGAIHWALRAWLPPRWALVGGLLAVAHPLLLQWGQNYWGGALAAAGGALLIGAFPRLWRRPRALLLAIVAVGLAILANTRPFEGLVLALLLGVPLAYHHRRRPVELLRRSAWGLAVLIVAAGGMMYYNHRVTSHAFRLPYMVYESQYAAAPLFVWQSAPPAKEYRSPAVGNFELNYEQKHWRKELSLGGWFIEAVRVKIPEVAGDYLRPALALPFLLAPWLGRRRRRVRRAALILALFLLASTQANWLFAHYVAPGTALCLYLVTVGLRSLWRWRMGTLPAGRLVVALVLVGQVAGAGWWISGRREALAGSWTVHRMGLEARMRESGGRHVVFVRYGPEHLFHTEWVYNTDDIDAQDVVWARDLGDAENRRLMAYYRDRSPWLLYDDAGQADLWPYFDVIAR